MPVVNGGGGCDFARENDDVVLYQSFASDVAIFIGLQAGVEYGVADLVGVFVGVVFAYLFGAEKSHFSSISLFLIVTWYFSGMY